MVSLAVDDHERGLGRLQLLDHVLARAAGPGDHDVAAQPVDVLLHLPSPERLPDGALRRAAP